MIFIAYKIMVIPYWFVRKQNLQQYDNLTC